MELHGVCKKNSDQEEKRLERKERKKRPNRTGFLGAIKKMKDRALVEFTFSAAISCFPLQDQVFGQNETVATLTLTFFFNFEVLILNLLIH